MKYRSTIVYLAAVLLLGGLYFWVIHLEKEEQAREKEAKVLFNLDADELELITLERQHGTGSLVIERTGDETGGNLWTITAPVTTGADDFSVNEIARLLPSLKYERIVEEDPSDPASFGLDPPALTVSWKAEDLRGSLLIGERNPIDRRAYYAATGDKSRVFLLGSGDTEVLDKDLYELRDKGLFTITSDRVTRFVLERPSGTWSFIKSGETMWALEGEPEITLDPEQISAAVRRLTWEEAASFEEEQADNLEPYGLEQPSLRILLSDGEFHEELLLGDPVAVEEEEPRRYARIASRPHVMTVRETLLERHLPSSLEEILASAHPETLFGHSKFPIQK
ncbi:MAG: DUF4340 domain-containing protein [Thermodesulfobacteriota bacterium]